MNNQIEWAKRILATKTMYTGDFWLHELAKAILADNGDSDAV